MNNAERTKRDERSQSGWRNGPTRVTLSMGSMQAMWIVDGVYTSYGGNSGRYLELTP